jgi:hypothetical protein
LSRAEYQWLVMRLLYYRALHRVLVIEERACFHIFVGGYDVEKEIQESQESQAVVDSDLR